MLPASSGTGAVTCETYGYTDVRIVHYEHSNSARSDYDYVSQPDLLVEMLESPGIGAESIAARVQPHDAADNERVTIVSRRGAVITTIGAEGQSVDQAALVAALATVDERLQVTGYDVRPIEPVAEHAWMRWLALGLTALGVVGLILSIVAARKPTRVRLGLDLLRLALSIGALVAMLVILRISPVFQLYGIAFVVGLILGVIQGGALEVRTVGTRVMGRRSRPAVAAWGVGVLVAQTAVVLSRTGAMDIGQAVAWFGVALSIGLLFGRQPHVRVAREALAGSAVAQPVGTFVLLLLLAFGVLFSPFVAGPSRSAASLAGSTDAEVCELLPSQTPIPGAGAPTPADAEVAGCHVGDPSGVGFQVTILAFASGEAASAALHEGTDRFSERSLPSGFGDEGIEVSLVDPTGEQMGSAGEYFLMVTQRGQFLYNVSDDGVPVGGEPEENRVRLLMSEIDTNVRDYLASGAVGSEPPTTDPPATDPPATEPPLTEPPLTEPAGTVPLESEEPAVSPALDQLVIGPPVDPSALDPAGPDDAVGDGTVSPEEALASAVAVLIVMAGMGVISWTEAATAMEELLGEDPHPLLPPPDIPGWPGPPVEVPTDASDVGRPSTESTPPVDEGPPSDGTPTDPPPDLSSSALGREIGHGIAAAHIGLINDEGYPGPTEPRLPGPITVTDLTGLAPGEPVGSSTLPEGVTTIDVVPGGHPEVIAVDLDGDAKDDITFVDIDGDGVIDSATGDADGDGVAETVFRPGGPQPPPLPATQQSPTPPEATPSGTVQPAPTTTTEQGFVEGTSPSGVPGGDTDGDGVLDVYDVDRDGYHETARVDTDGDGIADTTYVDDNADGDPDATYVGREPGGPQTPAADKLSGLVSDRGVLTGPSAALLGDFLSDPTATRVEITPSLGPRKLGSLPGMEIWTRDAESLPRGGALIAIETKLPGGSTVPVDVLVRVRDGRLAVDAVAPTGAGWTAMAQAELVDGIIGGPLNQINADLEASGRVLTGVHFDETTGRLIIEAAPMPR